MPPTPTGEPVHLKPAAALAERVLLPGDPHRALQVAQHLLERPRMLNHHRGLWGYTGTAPDGELLSIQATGMGGPSTAIVVEELIGLGARTLVRIGTCGALVDRLDLGELIVARAAVAADGTSAAIAGEEVTFADPELSGALAQAAGTGQSTVVSTDLFYDDRVGVGADWVARDAVAVEMEAATLFALARRRVVRAASVLGVTDLLDPGGPDEALRPVERLPREEIEAVGVRLGEVALAALIDAR